MRDFLRFLGRIRVVDALAVLLIVGLILTILIAMWENQP